MQNQSNFETPSTMVALGGISGVYGIKGWVKVHSSTDPVENILSYKTWRLKLRNQDANQEVVVKLVDGRKHGKGIVAKFEGYDDRDQAEALVKAQINVAAEELPELPKDEYYWRELVGLKVINMDGQSYGIIDHMMPTVANDVIVAKDGDIERLIPFIQGVYVMKVDLNENLIQVDWPEDF